ncbi:McrC family protein [Flavobacterium sp.]|uniref:McrC family protein n=1 Tax=Flavobacterium sp. TaxID=239 RepID=UPI0025BCFA11|nr:restriction endonuclease [Flavobacterium sp.]
MNSTKLIQIFEYATLICGQKYNGNIFEKAHFNALVKLNEAHQNKYFTIGLNKITFPQYVGVIQVDGLTIEILPKIDNDGKDESVWHKALIEMLRVTRKLKVQQVDEAHVKKQQVHLLDIYFEWFLNEVQLLLHQGLIKKYYKETSNVKALKGKLEFAKHISHNLVHKERFYTTHQVYDKDHLIHQILGQALEIVASLSKGNYLYSSCKTVQLNFPEVKTIQANEQTFSKIPNTRKTAPYTTALKIARLIILNYAPNVQHGSEKMIALLFDMNVLWEEYILVRLQQTNKGLRILGQRRKVFWEGIALKPDIVIQKDKETTYILDTKWKNIAYTKPSTQDLRQMFVYNEYWKSNKAMLLYPSTEHFFNGFKEFNDKVQKCGLGQVSIFKEDLTELDDTIGTTILEWFEKD